MNYPLPEINLKALFLGDKGENVDLFKEILLKVVDEHVGWRQNYQPQDLPVITPYDKSSQSFEDTVNHMRTVFNELSSKLRTDSLPWHTAGRFWGHMNSETLMPAIIAYTAAMLWNGNNVAYESSPGTSQMEEEVGHHLAKMMNYKENESWGHICADGSIANLEGLWYARNLKSLPLAIKEAAPEYVEGKSEWELLNMSTKEILDIMEQIPDKLDDVKSHSARSGRYLDKLGKWLIPQTKHYSWMKAADIIGIGLDSVEAIDVDSSYRMDVDKLEAKIRELAAENIPVLGVVGVVGSTEEGQIDHIDKIVQLREKLAAEGIYYYIHVDAAYGGYARAIFLDENDEFLDYDKIDEVYKRHNIFTDMKLKDQWLTEDIYNAFKAMSQVETITIDPHKMGYIPYSAGAIVIKDSRMRDAISYFATYVFEKNADIPALLGAYILEGSKAGATAAAVWTAHKVLPLNVTGYGKLMGASIEGAYRFYNFLMDKSFNVNGKIIRVHPLTKPDFNMVDYVFNEEGNTDLEKMNKLNHDFFDYASYVKGELYNNEFITSHTDFAIPDYGSSPLSFVQKLGFSREEWDRAGKVTILRACALSPYAHDEEVFEEYMVKIENAMQEKLEKIYWHETNEKQK
ncbi:tyrosine decarboxylase [Paenibacillus apiarius]|uniref:Tyrosine decarboxylase n=1 Tax=Paenibacillus apiarius TaxID=46240 RepID=A0ABT4DV47_9BACL|nr:tyrosine decarboxylase [Paenibacillus apiarius]MCY9514890.1 tyrosine decarboxylase [Paenibacillus apiarius]MCY9521230.1 tyrosine decarboxylase [Paenibacillus apiarius]MCY9555466.1 tyrosine decarboxylase [Paenibacillus apiarius]MCY9560320.1 tyrosine decarboxylase [Paenibacillus apiarius]MCY9685670.1 tyrosine decarboxylase [Paenibacillus apiarius]